MADRYFVFSSPSSSLENDPLAEESPECACTNAPCAAVCLSVSGSDLESTVDPMEKKACAADVSSSAAGRVVHLAKTHGFVPDTAKVHRCRLSLCCLHSEWQVLGGDGVGN